MKTKRVYVCAECQRPVSMNGQGLKTATCPAHPFRYVSVPRDLSGGKEASRELRKAHVTVRRPTKVQVLYAN